MLIDAPILAPRLLLRNLTAADAGPRYLAWLCDSESTRFLESRFAPVDSEGALLSFVEAANASADSLLLGIFLKDEQRHIGNVKLGPIQRHHRRADIGFLIGEREIWGRGYASEAIAAVVDFASRHLGLERITAGCYANNIGSQRALVKAGFSKEATLPAHWVCDGRRVDGLLYGLNCPREDA